MAKKKAPSRALVAIQWTNPHKAPPDGAERVLWACTVLDRAYESEIMAHAPEYPLGSGYGQCFTAITPPPRRFSPERKAKIRKRNLRERLERDAPLFAGWYYERELERRPTYFAGINPGTDCAPQWKLIELNEPVAPGHSPRSHFRKFEFRIFGMANATARAVSSPRNMICLREMRASYCCIQCPRILDIRSAAGL